MEEYVKRLKDFPILDSEKDNFYVLIDDDGVSKKIPLSKIKSLLTKAPGLVFDTLEEMQTHISEHPDELVIGQDLFIRDEDVPDYWWDGTQAAPVDSGVSSWNDLEDKPFGIDSEPIYIVSPINIQFTDGSGDTSPEVDSVDFTVGSTLYVVWDGITYEQTVKSGMYNFIGDDTVPFRMHVDGDGYLIIKETSGYTGTINVALARSLGTVKTLDEKYIPDSIARKDLSITSAAVGQTIKITEVDENGKPTKWEAVDMESGGTSDAVQYIPQELTEEQQMQARENIKAASQEDIVNSNWAQNDSTHKSYIHNRTHYYEDLPKYIETIDYGYQTPVDFDAASDIDISRLLIKIVDSRYDYVIDTINVNYNDRYYSEADEDSKYNSRTVKYYGNPSLLKYDERVTFNDCSFMEDTGENFVIYCYNINPSKTSPEFTTVAYAVIFNEYQSAYLNVYDGRLTTREYHPLDEVYIPDTIARKTDIPKAGVTSWNDLTDKPFYKETGVVYATKETVIDYQGSYVSIPSDLPADTMQKLFTIGATITVIVDGVEHNCTVKDGEEGIMFNMNWVGNARLRHSYNDNTGESFFVCPGESYTDLQIAFTDAGSHTISVYGVSEILKQIPSEYVPYSAGAVTWEIQELTDEQKQQVRSNIGASQTGFARSGGSWDALTTEDQEIEVLTDIWPSMFLFTIRFLTNNKEFCRTTVLADNTEDEQQFPLRVYHDSEFVEYQLFVKCYEADGTFYVAVRLDKTDETIEVRAYSVRGISVEYLQ